MGKAPKLFTYLFVIHLVPKIKGFQIDIAKKRVVVVSYTRTGFILIATRFFRKGCANFKEAFVKLHCVHK